MLTIRVTTPGTTGATTKRQWSKSCVRNTVREFINQCCGFEHTVLIEHSANLHDSQWS